MPQGTHKYFEQLDTRGGPISPEDPEFEAQVRARIGPEYTHRVDRSRAARVDSAGPSNYLGLHLSNPEEKASFVGDYGHMFSPEDRAQLMDLRKSIYGFDNGASPQTYAHEFRHEAGIESELQNRVQDLVFSASEPQYVTNVRMMFEALYRSGMAPHPQEVSFADKEDTVLDYVSKHSGVEQQIDSGDQAPLELLNQYPFLTFAEQNRNPRNPGNSMERKTQGYARGGRSRRSNWSDYIGGLAGGAQGARYVYDAANTVPVLSALGGVSDATTATTATAVPTAADLGVTVGPGALSSLLGVAGVFNTAMNVLGGGTFQDWIHGPSNHATPEQVQAVNQVLEEQLGDRYQIKTATGADGRTPWTAVTVDGNPLNNEQYWRLATGRSIGAGSENPIQIDWNTGKVVGTSTPPTGGTPPPQGGTDINGDPVIFNDEGVLGQVGVWDILNNGGSGTPGTDTGDYDNYPTTGGVTGGTPTPSGSGSWDEILAGAGTGIFGSMWNWVKNKWPDLLEGSNNGALGEFSDWFGDLPWYIKAGLGAGAVGLIGDSLTEPEYNPNAPPKFPGQPTTLPMGAPRTPLAPNIDYYTYGQRPGVAFFSDVNVPPQPSGPVESMPATESGGYPQASNPGNQNKPNWLPGVPTYKARGGALANSYFTGGDSGRADTIDARLSPGEYVMDAETVALLGDGNNEAGARKLDQMRQNLRKHKGRALAKGKFSANARDPEHYLRNA